MEIWMQALTPRGKKLRGYEVSSLGRVRSYWGHGPKSPLLTTPRLRKPSRTVRNGPVVCVRCGGPGELYTFRVHELVMRSFFRTPPKKGWVVAHLNGNLEDNRLENLRWVSRSESGLRSAAERPRRPLAKLTPANVRLIRRSPKTVAELAEKFGVGRRAVYDIRWGRTWRDVE